MSYNKHKCERRSHDRNILFLLLIGPRTYYYVVALDLVTKSGVLTVTVMSRLPIDRFCKSPVTMSSLIL